MSKASLYPAALLLLAACGGSRAAPLPASGGAGEQVRQRELALADVEHHQARLDSVSFPLLARATALCPAAVGYRLGMRVATIHEYEEPWRAAAAALRLSDTLAVLGLVRDGPAGDAGLRPGDRLLEVDGRPVPVGAGAAAAFAAAVGEARLTGGRLTVAYRRNGERHEAGVVLVPGCDYGTHVVVGGELNAYADGRNILVTSTLMRFTDDAELRVVAAHELAHNALGHIGMRRRSAMAGLPPSPGVTLGGYLTSDELPDAAPAFSPGVERQADEVALHALALAGFPLDAAPRFWRHVAQAEGIGLAATHPTPAERFVRMEQTIAEIERRRAAGLPLLATPPAAEPAAPTAPSTSSPAAGRDEPPPPAGRVRSVAELQLEQGLRETLRDVLRLGIAEAYEEVDPGLLVVALARDAFQVSSAEYNLKRLYLAYDRATLWPEAVSLELWQRGRAIGRYTREGLLLEPEAAPPAPGR